MSNAQNENSDSEEYEVEAILAAQYDEKDNTWIYAVKWWNYGAEHNTWEDEKNMQGAQDLMEEFWKHVGEKQPGVRVTASKHYIEKQMKDAKRLHQQNNASRNSPSSKEKAKGKDKGKDKADKGKDRTEKGKDKADKGKDKADKDKDKADKEEDKADKDKDKAGKVELGSEKKATSTSSYKVGPPTTKPNEKVKGNTNSRTSTTKSSITSTSSAPSSQKKKKNKSRSIISTSSSEDDIPLSQTVSKGAIKKIQLKPTQSATPRSEGIALASSTNAGTQPTNKAQPMKRNSITGPPPSSSDSDDEHNSLFSGSDDDAPLATKAIPASTSRGPPQKVPFHRTQQPRIKMIETDYTEASGIKAKAKIALPSFKKKSTIAPQPETSASQVLTDNVPAANNQWLSDNPISTSPVVSSWRNAGDSTGPMSTSGWGMSSQPVANRWGAPNEQSTGTWGVAATRDLESDEQMGPVSSTAPAHTPPTAEDPAADFLSSLQSNLDAPLLNPSLSASSRKSGQMQKKWSWNGDLFVGTDDSSFIQYGSIVISDPTEPRSGDLEFRFTNFALAKGSPLRITTFHSISALQLVLTACKPATQLLKVGPHSDEDKQKFGKLVTFMDYSHVVALVELFVGELSVGFLALFPTENNSLSNDFGLFGHMRDNKNLTAAVLPWKISTDIYRKVRWWGSLEQPSTSIKYPRGKEETSLPSSSRFISRGQSLRISEKGPITQRMIDVLPALSLLHFPYQLAEKMSYPERPFIIWDDHPPESPHLETRALRTVLAACSSPRPAKEVQPQDYARFIFVHVGALATLYRLPRLAERRRKHPETLFFLYGTHPNVSPVQWGMREAFILGGIVTFTAKCLAENPWETCDLIRRISKHPHWACYILTSVLAIAIKLTSANGTRTAWDETNRLILSELSNLIEEDEIALLQTISTIGNLNSDMETSSPLSLLFSVDIDQFSEQDLPELARRHDHLTFNKVQSEAELDIIRRMTSMQSQPTVMEEYRRYVIVRSEGETHLSSGTNGLEWVTLNEFSFMDNYFNHGHVDNA